MNERIKQLQDQLEKLVVDARSIIEKAEGEKRDLDQEETTRYGKFVYDIASMKTRIERERILFDEESRLRKPVPTLAGGKEGQPSPAADRSQRPGAVHRLLKRGHEYLDSLGWELEPENVMTAKRDIFRRYIRGGNDAITTEERRSLAERRDLQMDADTQ